MDVIISTGPESRTTAKVRELVLRFKDHHITVNYDQYHTCKSIRGLSKDPTLLLLVDFGKDYDVDFSTLSLDKSFVMYDGSIHKCANKVGMIITDDKCRSLFYSLPNIFNGIVFLRGKELDIARRYTSNPLHYNHFIWEMLSKLVDEDSCELLAIPLSSIKIKQKENSLVL